ncbi:helix-turn-helix domain-containing protein [Tardiphaga sp. 20_F10_N6_6]|uniref:helix-turn-helix domain-containing protein n=1 Tax=Tardiphaga sp. 20_F10_N6_6 TaxID=3240788 RepID=UPI003F8CE07D
MAAAPNQIARIRKERGLSQQQLAEKLGVHWITVSKLERGKQRLTTEWMDKIAAALEVGRWVLLGDTEPVAVVNLYGRLTKRGIVDPIPADAMKTRHFYKWTFDDPEAVWYEVGEDGFFPMFHKGDLLKFSLERKPPQEYLGRLCTVQDKERNQFFGVLANGSAPGLFDIQVIGDRPIRDIQVAAIAQLTMALFDEPEQLGPTDEDGHEVL